MTVRRFMTLASALLIAVLAGTIPASAQTPPTASFHLPMNGASNVPIITQFTIKTTHRIDSSSVTWNKPDGNPPFGPDTLFPTVFLIEKEFYDTLHDSVWCTLAKPGTYQLLDSVTLRMTPKQPLKWNTEYVAVVKNLRAYNNMSISVLVPETEIYFATAKLPHRLVSSNISNGQTICSGDTFKLQFSRKLTSLSTVAGNLVQLRRMVVDSAHEWGDSSVSISLAQSLSSDSTAIHAVPTGALVRASAYLMEVRTDYLTGDSTDHILIPLTANSRSKLTMSKARYGGGALPTSTRIYPDSGDLYFTVGDSVQLMAGYPGPGYQFKYWSSPGNAAIHQNTSPSLKIEQTCNDHTVTAVFEAIVTDSVRTYADSNGRAVLYSSHWDSLATNAGRLVHRQDSVWAIAIPDSGYSFEKWVSLDSNYHNLTTPMIRIRNLGGGIVVKAVFQPQFGGIEFKYCGVVVNPAGVTSTLATLSPGSCDVDDHERSGTITATMLDPTGVNACYRIMQRIDPNGGSVDYRPNGITVDNTLSWTLKATSPTPTVRFILAKKEFTLTVNKVMDDNSVVPPEAYVTVSPDKATYECGETVTLTAFDNETVGVKFLRWEPSMSTSKTLTVTMSENKTVTAVFESDFKLISHQWYIDNEVTPSAPLTPFQNALNIQILTQNPPTTYMILNFNREVDQTDLEYENGVSKIRVLETSRRIDFRTVGDIYQIYTPQSVTYVQWSPDGKSVKLELRNTASGLPVRKFQSMHIYVQDLVSATGVKMKPVGGPIYAQTENPDVIWAVDPLTIAYDQDPGGCGEVFSGWVAGRQRPTGNTMTSGRDPNSGTRCVSDVANQTIGLTFQSSIASTDILSAGIITIDEDGGDAVNKILGAVQGIANRIGQLNAETYPWANSDVKLGAAIAGEISGAMKGTWDNDDLIGAASWQFGQYSLWGYNASASELSITDGTAIFNLKVTLQ